MKTARHILICLSILPVLIAYNSCQKAPGGPEKSQGTILGNPNNGENAVGPKVLLNSALPASTGTQITVGAAGRQFTNCQAAIDAAAPGDEVVIDAGYVCQPITLKKKSGDQFIIIRSANLSQLPPEGTRISRADAPHFAIIETNEADVPAIRTQVGAHHYHLVGIEARVNANTTVANMAIIQLGFGLETEMSELAHDIVIARSWIHAAPLLEARRGIQLDALAVSIVDSIIEDIHRHNQYSQAIQGRNAGLGPYKIVNNELVSSGHAFVLGAAPTLIEGLIPSDVEFRKNYVHKLPEWRDPVTSNTGETGPWVAEGFIALQNAQRVLIEGNLFENAFGTTIPGYSSLGSVMMFAPIADYSPAQPWTRVQDIIVRNNIIRHAPMAFYIAYQDPAVPEAVARRIDISNNIIYDIGTTHGESYRMISMYGEASGPVRFTNNTFLDTPGAGVLPLLSMDNKPKKQFVFANNIVSSSLRFPDSATLNTHFPGVDLSRNILVGQDATRFPAHTNNVFPANNAAVGFVADPSAGVVDYQDLGLKRSSPFFSYGAGANVPAVDAAR